MRSAANTFSWSKPPQIDGEWFLSPSGDLCKSMRLPDGERIVLRNSGEGFWRGSEEDFVKIFRPLPSNPLASAF